MNTSALLQMVEVVLGLSIAIGSSVWLLAAGSAFVFRSRIARQRRRLETWPAVTILKPIYGIEKNLRENLRSSCQQDYPDYQVVFSVQRLDDAALPLLRELEQEFGAHRVTVARENRRVGLNGKINNLAGALPHARHEILVISDSDVRLRPDYLKSVVGALANPAVGAASTFFKASAADTWYEQMEMLTLNADHFAMAMLASFTKLVDFCFGASTALTQRTLTRIGGLTGLGDFLVEDNELGQRIVRAGLKLVMVPYVVETTVDLKSPADWWRKQTYWDQNTKAAVPILFLSTLLLRIIPLSLVFAALRGGDGLSLGVVLFSFCVRLSAAAIVLGVALQDARALRSLWLVPIKDTLSLVWFVRAFLKRSVVWRGVEMSLTRDGRLEPMRGGRRS